LNENKSNKSPNKALLVILFALIIYLSFLVGSGKITITYNDNFDIKEHLLSQKDEVPCSSIPKENLMVALTFGQSQTTNSGPIRHKSDRNVYSLERGKCYKAHDPLVDADSLGGSVWPILGNKLIQNKVYDNVLFVAIGENDSHVLQWSSIGPHHKKIKEAYKTLTGYGLSFTHLLWHQGETDSALFREESRYKDILMAMIESLRAKGIDAPIYISVASKTRHFETNEDIRGAQKGLVNIDKGIYPGPDTDTLGYELRSDKEHFSEEGQQAFAMLWYDAIVKGKEYDKTYNKSLTKGK